MDIKIPRRRVAANVTAAIFSSSVSLATVAQAADMDEAALTARLNGDEDFTVNDLIHVGGFLRFPPARFMEGTAA